MRATSSRAEKGDGKLFCLEYAPIRGKRLNTEEVTGPKMWELFPGRIGWRKRMCVEEWERKGDCWMPSRAGRKSSWDTAANTR